MIFQIMQQITVFILAIILARLLSPAEFGIIALANLVIHYANNLSDLGFTNALVQNKNIEAIHINSVFTITFVISLILGIATFMSADYLASFFKNENLNSVLRWMSIYYMITSLHYLPMAILRRNLEYKFISIAEYIQSLVNYAATIALAYYGFSYWSIVYPTLFFTLIWGFIYMYRAKWLPTFRYNHHCMKEIYSFGFWSFIRAQLGMLISKVDYFVIGKFLPVRDLGVYEKSFELTERAFRGISMPLNTVFFSSFSRLQENRETQHSLFIDAVKMLMVLTLPILLGLIAVSRYFVHALLGEVWLDAVIPLRLLAFSALFRFSGGIISTLNIANGNYRQQTLSDMISAIVFIILCFSLIYQGINAIALSVIIYSIINFFLSAIILKKSINIGIIVILKASIFPLAAAGIMFLIVSILAETFFQETDSVFNFMMIVTVGILTYIPIILVSIKLGKFKLSFSFKNING